MWLTMSLSQPREEVKTRLWRDHLAEYGRTVCMFRTEKVRRLVAMGLPQCLRGRLWLLFSGERACALGPCDFWSRRVPGVTWGPGGRLSGGCDLGAG